MSRAALMAALLAALCVPARADAQRNEATLEASVIRGALGYAREMSPRALIGVEIGFGFPQIDRTLEPATDEDTGEPDFEEYLHVALFARFRGSDRFEIDTGVRGSIADLWSSTASDSWPSLFGGAYVQPMIGGRTVKVGTRLTAGWIGDSPEGGPEGSTFVVGLVPILVRATVRW